MCIYTPSGSPILLLHYHCFLNYIDIGRGQGRTTNTTTNTTEGRRVQADPQATERDFFMVSEFKSRLRTASQSVKDRLQQAPYNLGGTTAPGSGGMLTKEGSVSANSRVNKQGQGGGATQPQPRQTPQTSSSSSSSSSAKSNNNNTTASASSSSVPSESSLSSSAILQEASRYVRHIRVLSKILPI